MTEGQRQLMLPALGGATHGYQFPTKAEAYLAVTKLMCCLPHFGEHHFAVIGNGQTVWMSQTGVNCLVDQGILPETERVS
jgi:hypothetical protein